MKSSRLVTTGLAVVCMVLTGCPEQPGKKKEEDKAEQAKVDGKDEKKEEKAEAKP